MRFYARGTMGSTGSEDAAVVRGGEDRETSLVVRPLKAVVLSAPRKLGPAQERSKTPQTAKSDPGPLWGLCGRVCVCLLRGPFLPTKWGVGAPGVYL